MASHCELLDRAVTEDAADYTVIWPSSNFSSSFVQVLRLRASPRGSL